jgi:hypothetical protein
VAGLLAAAAFLTRYNAVYLLPAGLIAILAGAAGGPARLRAAARFVGGFLVLVVPWVLYSLAHGGTLALQLHHNIAYEVFARRRVSPGTITRRRCSRSSDHIGDRARSRRGDAADRREHRWAPEGDARAKPARLAAGDRGRPGARALTRDVARGARGPCSSRARCCS